MGTIKITLLVSFFVLFQDVVKAQTSKNVKISNHIVMVGQMDEVWTGISDLSNLDTIVPEIISSTKKVGNGKGSVVTLTLTSTGLKVIEEVIKLNNNKHILVYKMLETPLPIEDYKATIKITPLDGNEYSVNFSADFRTKENNRETMITTIDTFQKTFLSNIKKTYNDEQ